MPCVFGGSEPSFSRTDTSLFRVLSLGLMVLLASACGDDSLAPGSQGGDRRLDEWASWLQENGHGLTSLTSDDFSDLQFLKDAIGERRYVQLGESGHGVAEFTTAKVRLIKFLHQEMGFDVIAFESGFYECFQADRGADTLTAKEFMYQCPFRVWHVWELVPLFEYIKSTQGGDHPLTLAGFDIQASQLGRESRGAFLEKVISAVDPEYGAQVRSLEDHLTAILNQGGGWLQSLANHAASLRVQWAPVLSFLDDHEEALLQEFHSDQLLPLVARQAVWSTLQWIDMAEAGESTAGDYCRQFNERDQSMSANFSYLAKRMYPEEKIMVWAHNMHIQHIGEYESGNCIPMGQHLSGGYRGDLYTIALLMYQGSAAWNDRSIYQIDPPPVVSLEGILHQAGHPIFFLDLLHREPADAPWWIFEPIPTREWGTQAVTIRPREHFDALLYFEHVNPPSFTY